MIKKWTQLSAIAAAACAHGMPPFASADTVAEPSARIETGKILGRVVGATFAFKGVPYAAPPIGPLRWRPPHRSSSWPGVRDAGSFGAACPQAADRPEFWAKVGATSEDCLFLNVWRPMRPGRYPVMVFIHGGAFNHGSADIATYDGERLATRGAVIVTLNYRIGRLGFFAHPALTRESPNATLGNYGFMDQIAALQWIRRNIAQFAGDPRNVTLFGESAGAGAVQVLTGSPMATGLFQKAIAQSGAGLAVLAPIRGTPQSAEMQGVKWATSLGLPNATAEQLRAIPLADLVRNSQAFPFIDGKLVVASPGERFYAGAQMRIPMMIGSNSNEASLVANNPALGRVALGDAYDTLLKAYADRPGRDASVAGIDLVGDAFMVLPANAIAVWQRRCVPNVYAYYFDQVPVGRRAGTLGAPHAGELQYLFGNPSEPWDVADRRVSDLMGDYWVRFARIGNPNDGEAPAWPDLGNAASRYLAIGAKTRAASATTLDRRVQAILVAKAIQGWQASE